MLPPRMMKQSFMVFSSCFYPPASSRFAYLLVVVCINLSSLQGERESENFLKNFFFFANIFVLGSGQASKLLSGTVCM